MGMVFLVWLVVGQCLVVLRLRLVDYKAFLFADLASLRTRSKRKKVLCGLHQDLSAAINHNRFTSSSAASRTTSTASQTTTAIMLSRQQEVKILLGLSFGLWLVWALQSPSILLGFYFGSIKINTLICSKLQRYKTSFVTSPLHLSYYPVVHKLSPILRDVLWFVNRSGFLLGVRMSSPVRLMTFESLSAAECLVFSDEPYRCYIRNQSRNVITSLFHRGNGIPHMKCIHLLLLTGFLPVRCSATLKGSYEVIEKLPLSLRICKRRTSPTTMLGLKNPTRSSSFSSFSLSKIEPEDDFASVLTRMIVLVRTRMVRNVPLSSIFLRMVETLDTIPKGTKSVLTVLLTYIDVSSLKVATKLVLASLGGKISFLKSQRHVINVRASNYSVESRLTHPRLVMDPLSFIFRDDHSIPSYVFMNFMFFALSFEDLFSLLIFVLATKG